MALHPLMNQTLLPNLKKVQTSTDLSVVAEWACLHYPPVRKETFGVVMGRMYYYSTHYEKSVEY